METADLLAARGIDTQVVSMHTVKPLDEGLLARVFSEFDIVATVEEHSLGGGVAEWLCDRRPTPTGAEFLRFAVPDAFIHGMGRQKEARRSIGLDGETWRTQSEERWRRATGRKPRTMASGFLTGIDFDNTIICYDRLFHQIALEGGLIPRDLPAEKNAGHDYLREQGRK
jgi:hypothetical protein